MDLDHLEAKVQISPEFLAFYEKREVSVSRCDEPNVHGLGLTRTDAADLALLEHS